MKKNDVKVKELINFNDQVDMINLLAGSYFTTNEDGEVIYTPYMEPVIFKMLFFSYFVDGLEVEPIDADGNVITMEDALELYDNDESLVVYESLLEAVEKDQEVNALFGQYTPGGDSLLDNLLDSIRLNAQDMAQFRKAQIVNRRTDELAQIAYGLGEIGRLLKSMNFDQLTPEVAMQALATGFAKSEEFKEIIKTLPDVMDSNKVIPFKEVSDDENRHD